MADLLSERDGHVLNLTLNRPDRMNAISGPMLEELSRALEKANGDPDVRAVVVTGAGRGFCAGLDLQDVAAGNPISGADGSGPTQTFDISGTPPLVLRRIDVPVICALNGPAAGYGMDLALGCDLVIASDQARFVPPVRRSVIPESGGTWLLPRLIGWHKACEVTLLGRKLDAEKMESLGLVNEVVPHDALAERVREISTELASNPPLAVAAAKRTMRLGMDSTFEANSHHVMAELMQLFRSADFREGIQAFMEKRDPEYRGR